MPENRILVVANQTLGGEDMLALVRQRVTEGVHEVWIVVPATAPREGLAAGAVTVGVGMVNPHARDDAPDADPYVVAERRLELAKERLGALGAQVGGEVGHGDPFQAVSDVMEHRRFDEVIVSTLPSGLSRWLRSDLPSRVRRAFDVPVTTVTARVAPRT